MKAFIVLVSALLLGDAVRSARMSPQASHNRNLSGYVGKQYTVSDVRAPGFASIIGPRENSGNGYEVMKKPS
jgi:hypothetical protein